MTQCRPWRVWLLLALVGLGSLGCAHVISEPIRQQATPAIPFRQLQAHPETYQNRTVILGGEILETQNTAEGSLIEILQQPLSAYEVPLQTDQTEGRFMALCDAYLDPEIYTKGRQLTVAGRVLGERKGKIGDATYVYPLLSCLELKLWPQTVAQETRYDIYPSWYWGWYWGPWYWRPSPYIYWHFRAH